MSEVIKTYRVIYKPNEKATVTFGFFVHAKNPTDARVRARIACGAGIVILEVKEV